MHLEIRPNSGAGLIEIKPKIDWLCQFIEKHFGTGMLIPYLKLLQ